MTIEVKFLGATGEVTGSCHLVTVGDKKILLDSGLVQGEPQAQECFSKVLQTELNADVIIARRGQKVDLLKH